MSCAVSRITKLLAHARQKGKFQFEKKNRCYYLSMIHQIGCKAAINQTINH